MLRFRFTDPADAQAYGDQWRLWDENAVYAMRSRELVALELALGMPVLRVIQAFSEETVIGRLGVMWIVLHREGHKVAWKDFDPLALEVEWEVAPPEDPTEGSGGDPAPEPNSSNAAAESAESTTS